MRTEAEANIRIKTLESVLTDLVNVCILSDNYDVNFEGDEHDALKRALSALLSDPKYQGFIIDSAYSEV